MRFLLHRGAFAAAVIGMGIVVALVPAVQGAATMRGGTSHADVHQVAARATLDRLTLVDRAGQLVMTSVPGRSLTRLSMAQLRSLRPGGVIVFGDNYRSRSQLRAWTRAVQIAGRAGSEEAPRLLVSIDQEGGVVKRIPDAPPSRSHPQLGASNRPALTRAQGRATAIFLRQMGIQLDLAPVADLDLGPGHTMRERAFGGSPTRTATHVAAFVAGLRAGGGAAAVKHFPGFGGAPINSDDAVARITRSRAQLELDLAPFRAAIAAGTDAVMVSHGVYRSLDRRQPASVSPHIYGMLRHDLGFEGLAITDSLHATGFVGASRSTPVLGCARAIIAGADVALVTGTLVDAARCRAAILTELRSGRLSRERLDDAVLHLLELKSRQGLLPKVPAPQ